MLRTLVPKPPSQEYKGYVPPLVQRLLNAAKRGEDLIPVVRQITAEFGFDTLMSGVSMSLQPAGETLSYVFTTMPAEWVAIYDQRSFIEIDPRVQTFIRTGLPLIWDQRTLRGQSSKVDEFLDIGLKYGLGSGIAVCFVDPRGHGAIFALNSRVEYLSSQRTAEISSKVPDILLFAHFFHEMFVSNVIQQGRAPASRGAPLSLREKECITLAAHGLTSDDIGQKLGITERTVQFHFDSIRSKLAAATRQEAIAKAMQAGIIKELI